jgi:hypothetical protein
MVPSLLYLILYIHLHPTGFLFLGNSMISQVLLFSKAFNSSFIALNQYELVITTWKF